MAPTWEGSVTLDSLHFEFSSPVGGMLNLRAIDTIAAFVQQEGLAKTEGMDTAAVYTFFDKVFDHCRGSPVG